MLEDTDHEGARVARQDVLGAIAVVHIKVHHRHAVQVVALQRVFGSHRHVVEKAKTHRLAAGGVVARGAHRAKGVFQLAGHHGIGGGQGGARSAQRGLPGVRVDGGVGVELRVIGAARHQFFIQPIRHAPQRGHVHPVVGQFNVGQGGFGGFKTLQRISHSGDQQAVFNGIQPLRAFRVARAHFVFPTIPVREIARLAHSLVPVSRLIQSFSDNVAPWMHSTKSTRFWISLTR